MSTFLQYISYYIYITCIWADGDMAWKLGNTAVKQDITSPKKQIFWTRRRDNLQPCLWQQNQHRQLSTKNKKPAFVYFRNQRPA